MTKGTPANISQLVKDANNKSSWKIRLAALNELKQYDCQQSRDVITRLALHLPVSFRGPTRQLSCAAQAASQPSRAKIRKLLYHRFQSGGFLLVMYNRRDRRVIPSRNSGGTFHPRGKRCHDSLDLFLITTTILP